MKEFGRLAEVAVQGALPVLPWDAFQAVWPLLCPWRGRGPCPMASDGAGEGLLPMHHAPPFLAAPQGPPAAAAISEQMDISAACASLKIKV